MDPITLIVAALSAGAVAGLKNTASTAVKDAYGALKRVLSHKYPSIGVTQLEENPTSTNRQGVVAEDLAKLGVERDEELIEHAKKLLAIIRTNDPEAARVVGIGLKGITGESLEVSDVTAVGTDAIGAHVEDARIDGPIKISRIHAEDRPDQKKT